ncbi:MAG: hypothetical protein MR695_06095 [Solobacterium sp.]|nr:hypothetical protein [Solobacterium sp.]
MKSRAAGKVQTKLVMLAYGATFSGKTTLGLQFAYFKRPDGKPFRLAVVDAEGGGVDDAIEDLEDNGVDMRNIHVFYTQSLKEVTTLLDKIKNRKTFYEYDDYGNESDEEILDADGKPWFPDAILIDGTSVLKLTSEQGLLELSKKRNTVKADKDNLIGAERFVKIQGADLEFKDYKSLNYSGQNLVLDLMAIGINVFLTAREKDETIQTKDKNGNQVSLHTGKKIIDSFKGIDYNCKTILHMYQDKESGQICAEVIKDRTKVHSAGENLEDPTLLDWQSVIIKNKDKKEFILKNDLDKAVETEQKMYEEEAMKLHNEVIGTKSSTQEQNNSSSTKTATQLRDEIYSYLKPLTLKEKNAIKEKLAEAGLPTAFKSVKDVEILQTVLDTI